MVMFSRADDDTIRAAHEAYYGARKAAAPIRVRNAQAMVALGEHRPLRWRSHAYRVPPLPWKDGARLLVISQALATGEGAERERACKLARAMMHGLVQVRRFGRWVRPVLNPFRAASIDELRQLADFFLHVPDENTPPSGRATSVDLMAGVMDFAERWPAFVNAQGFPVSWAHFQHGLRSLARVRARDDLRAAQAARVSQAPKADWLNYSREMQSVSGVN